MTGTMWVLAASAVCGADYQDYAGSFDLDKRPRSEDASGYYRSHEFSLDAFGGATFAQQTTFNPPGTKFPRDIRPGTGFGADYFLTRNIGIEGDTFTQNTGHSLIDHASGSLVLRFPFGHSGLSAYALGGGGRQFDPIPTTTTHAGAGLEYRFSPRLGVFIEPRVVFTYRTRSFGLGRIGVRYTF